MPIITDDPIAMTEDDFAGIGDLEAFVRMRKAAEGKTTKTLLPGIWAAVCALTACGETISRHTVGDLIGMKSESVGAYLRDLWEIGLLTKRLTGTHRGGSIVFALNNHTNRDMFTALDSDRRNKKSARPASKNQELKELRKFRKKFEGIDLDKLRILMEGL